MKHIFIGVSSGLAAGLVILLALFNGPWSLEASPTPVATQTVSVEPEETQEPSPEPTEEVTAEPQEEIIECSVSEFEDAEDILDLQAQVIDAETGEILFDRGSATPARAASLMKLFTAAAALETLGPNYRVTTRVYVDSLDPSIIYLVGAGDITLSRTGIGIDSVYDNAPDLADLANQISSWNSEQTFSQIVLDSSIYGSADGEYQSVWDQRGLTNGYMSPVSALQVDGDRDNPGAKDSPRSTDPVTRAGLWFQEALGESASAAVIAKGIAPPDAIEIASVLSARMSTWIDYMLVVSDNTLAEAISRLVSLDVGLNGSFSSLTQAYQRALRDTGLDLSGLIVEDGSGLSRYNQVAPETVNELLKLIDSGYGDFEIIRAGMPVAGTPGSLSARFDQAVGKITAKTGWIRTGYSLAGFLQPDDQNKLIFTVYNLGDVQIKHREAMDALVMGFYNCGTTLVNR
jgi:D-alanyl-D-alanine carboxypeptidase/D-alanyl-D-alanine-endopeptidase (penicillin-binding protein 4)